MKVNALLHPRAYQIFINVRLKIVSAIDKSICGYRCIAILTKRRWKSPLGLRPYRGKHYLFRLRANNFGEIDFLTKFQNVATPMPQRPCLKI
jgi:hypothetical protein